MFSGAFWQFTDVSEPNLSGFCVWWTGDPGAFTIDSVPLANIMIEQI